MQAISGAGYPGVGRGTSSATSFRSSAGGRGSSSETQKILGRFANGAVEAHPVVVQRYRDAQCRCIRPHALDVVKLDQKVNA